MWRLGLFTLLPALAKALYIMVKTQPKCQHIYPVCFILLALKLLVLLRSSRVRRTRFDFERLICSKYNQHDMSWCCSSQHTRSWIHTTRRPMRSSAVNIRPWRSKLELSGCLSFVTFNHGGSGCEMSCRLPRSQLWIWTVTHWTKTMTSMKQVSFSFFILHLKFE